MGNTSPATKLAIARLRGDHLPAFVPRSEAEKIANLVRECILQADSTKRLNVTAKVKELLDEQLMTYQDPQYTIPQYLLMMLYTVSTINTLVEQHNTGEISDRDFINNIKNHAE